MSKPDIRRRPFEMHLNGKAYTVYGGPYAKASEGDDMRISLLAPEEVPGDWAQPTHEVPAKDFGLPDDQKQCLKTAVKAWRAAIRGEQVYVGCGWGQGRTGTFLGVMAGLADETQPTKKASDPGGQNPIIFVRKAYWKNAVETDEQAALVLASWKSLTARDWFRFELAVYQAWTSFRRKFSSLVTFRS